MDTNSKKALLDIICSWRRMIARSSKGCESATLDDLDKSMKYVLDTQGYKPRIVKQFSIDVEMDEDDLLVAEDISNQLDEVWTINGKKGREIVGESWRATWTAHGYHNSEDPIDSD